MVGYAQDVPGSPGEMQKLRGHLTAMIDQIYADTGRLPLLFSTVTSANTHWWHLHRLLPVGRASDIERLGLRDSDDEDRLAEDDCNRMADGDQVAKRRNWVEDTVSWKTHGDPNGGAWQLPGVQQRRAAVRRFPMVVAWFGQLRLELVRRYGAQEMMNVIDSYDVTEWSKTGGNMHKHSIDWVVDETPCDIDAEMASIQEELDKRHKEGNPDLRLRLEGVTKFVDLADKYVSEWNACKDAQGKPNQFAASVEAYCADRDHPAAVSHEELMFMCGRSQDGHSDETRQKRLLHISALSNHVCMHDYHLPDVEGPPHLTAACAKVVGANPDTGEEGHAICVNGFPMTLIARREEERIEHDSTRGDLFQLRLARNCPVFVGGNKNIRFFIWLQRKHQNHNASKRCCQLCREVSNRW